MSKYTTEVRFICETASGLNESKGYNSVADIIRNALPKVFNFNFPIFDEEYRSILETKILKHFYTREIGEETVGLWKLRLDTKLNEIMPYYNKLYESELFKFNPMYTNDITTTRKINGGRNENENINDVNTGEVNSTSKTDNKGHTSGTVSNNSTDKYSDTPQGALNGLLEDSYLTNARVIHDSGNNTGDSTSSSDSTGTVKNSGKSTRARNNGVTSTEDYLEHVVGYNGIIPSELLMKYRDSIINIDMMIIRDLEDLFIQLW